MLTRRRSIFHLQEEEEATKIEASAIRDQSGSSNLAAQETKIEGLRILIQHSGDGRRNNVVIKCSLKKPSSSPSSSKVSPPLMGLLKACFLCKRELCPHKDIYMYRGDKGFCSKECRRRQILRDERKELLDHSLMMRERSKNLSPPPSSSKASPAHLRQLVARAHQSYGQRKILAAA